MCRRCSRALMMGALLLIASAHVLTAQGRESAQGRETAEGSGSDALGPWKIANSVLFAIGFGYLIYRSAPRFFNARSADIQKAIQDATGLKMEADLRYSDIDRRMATLADEVKRLRDQNAIEMGRERVRRAQESEEEVAHIHSNVEAEVEALRLGGIQSLRLQAANAALDLAAKKIGRSSNEAESRDLLQDFIHLVERGKN